jgi:putative hydrolase of the HAD superfamily
MPEVKAVCFDLFHTLVDVGGVPDYVGRYTADVLGLDHDEWNQTCFSDLHEIRRPTSHFEVIKTLAHSVNPDIEESVIHEAVRHRDARFHYALTNVEPDVIEFFQRWRESGLPCALVSNASTAEVAAWEQSPLAEFLDYAVFSCECGHAKPDRDIYHLAASKLQAAPEEILFIGDGGSQEHRGAEQAGMTPVLLSRFIKSRMAAERFAQRAAAAHHEIENLHELFDLLEALDQKS